MQRHVVAFDPADEVPEGKVFIQDERYFEARRRGVVFLPIRQGDGLNALSPWAKFSFGDGPAASDIVPAYVGRGALWLAQGRGTVAWAALLRHPVGNAREGLLRLAGDATQAPLVSAPISADERNSVSVGRPSHSGPTHAIVEGQAYCQTAMTGVFAFALHGWARGCRLAWLALSQAD